QGIVCALLFGLPACGQPEPQASLQSGQQEEQASMPLDADCHDCHGTDTDLKEATSGYKDAAGEAFNPHNPVDRKETDPRKTHTSPAAALLRCTLCHGTHSLPYDPDEATVKQADASYCYRACHHQDNFRPCWECHEG
ncbi:MAG: hypothetical protein LBG81_09480, partial [Coriobacteriaceae bacterium]|nr:hypothetical protein [Coriobacteriaceae bacterium]